MLCRVLCAVFILLGGPLSAAEWTINPAKSEIRFSGTHLGNAFDGVFESWSADISFDAADPRIATVHVTIETATATTGNQLYDGTLETVDWFDVKRHPHAVFDANAFALSEAGGYVADGTLTIKGNPVPLSLQFALAIEDGIATMTAHHIFDRTLLGLGSGSDPEAKWVSREIAVKLSLVATRR